MKNPFLFSLSVVLSLVSVMWTANAQDDIPGTLAYIGSDFNVYTYTPTTDTTTALSDDAGLVNDVARIYLIPTWATDGRLAYFASETSRTGSFATEIFIAPDAQNDGVSVYRGNNESFNYAYWSPSNCSVGANCRDLAVLISSASAGGFAVEVIRDSLDGVSNQTAGRGAPFYYSWSPDGGQMLWQRNSARLDIYDAVTGTISESLPQIPGAFYAPSWSPVDDRLLIAGRNEAGNGSDLLIIENDGTIRPIVSNVSTPVYFAWSPTGRAIAFSSRGGALTVIDAATGDVIARTLNEQVTAFFWSPSGQRIAYLILDDAGSFSTQGEIALRVAQTAQDVRFRWVILDVERGDSQVYDAFTPTRELLYLLSYFDQFAQSHRLWSPDSRYIVYSDVISTTETAIRLLDVEEPSSQPLTIAEGRLAIWSYK